MKKVFGIALLLVVLVSAMAHAVEPADQNPWRLYLKSTDTNGSYAAGTLSIATATNAVDGYASGTGDTVMSFTGFQPTAACVAAVSTGTVLSVDAKTTKVPTNSVYAPSFQKVWDLRVGSFPSFAGSAIRLTMTFVSSAAGIPPATGPNYRYFIKMVDNLGVANAPANGTVWDITMPPAYTTSTLWTIDLPVFQVSKDSAGMLGGYQMQFVQTVVPEPSSMMALGAGLMGLVGFAARRRKS